MNTRNTCAALLATLWLGACSTPQPMLDQANHGAALSMALQAELVNFRQVQAGIAQQRMDSIRQLVNTMATYQADADFDERVSKLAGNTATAKLFKDLQTLADSRTTDEQALLKELAEMEAQLTKLLQPLPDNTQALDATQRQLAAMGHELPWKERLKVVSTFAKAVNQSVKANRQKLQASQSNKPDDTDTNTGEPAP